ncbi:MAG TPA: hypothetical protein GX514_10135, partial [Thermoanaerobacterales bacterium]|nr:hypothetical protein [Thermoanaerobacterales bacterium]
MIYTKSDLNEIRNHVVDGKITGYFKLANDIVFDDADFEEGGEFYNDGMGWIPIGHNNEIGHEYSGMLSDIHFDGNGHSIINLKIFGSEKRYYNSFIAAPENSTIINVNFINTYIDSYNGAGVVYAESFGNTVVENVVIDGATLINRGGAAKPSGIFVSYMKGSAENITIKNSTLTHIDPLTKEKGYGWSQAFFAGRMKDNCRVNNVIISNCSGEFYAYSSLLVNNVESDVEIRNVSITDSSITWTHYRYFNLLGNSYDDGNAGRENVLIDNIYANVKYNYDYNPANNVRKLIPSETGFKLSNALILIEQSVSKDIDTSINPENPDNLVNVFIIRKNQEGNEEEFEYKKACASNNIRI